MLRCSAQRSASRIYRAALQSYSLEEAEYLGPAEMLPHLDPAPASAALPGGVLLFRVELRPKRAQQLRSVRYLSDAYNALPEFPV